MLLVAAAGLVALAAACTPGRTTPGTAKTSVTPSQLTTTARTRSAFQAYRACLAAHGVTLPSPPIRAAEPGSSPSARPPESLQASHPAFRHGFLATADPTIAAALRACASVAPSVRPAVSQVTFDAFKSCMKDNGVTIEAGDPAQALRDLDRSDPRTAAALRICQPILGSGMRPAPSPTPAAS